MKISRNKDGKGVAQADLAVAYEQIIRFDNKYVFKYKLIKIGFRAAYLDTGNCTEEDIVNFCGYFKAKLENELLVWKKKTLAGNAY